LGIREELIIVRRFLLGIGALLAIAVILVGVPIALIVVAGNPLPTSSQIHNIVTLVPDYGNVALLTKVLPCLGWVAWIFFAVPLLVEIGAGIVGRRTTKRIWLVKGQQHAAATLVVAVLVMFTGFGAIHISAPPIATAPRPPATSIEPVTPMPTARVASPPTVEPAAVRISAVPESPTQTFTHTVVPGDNLWEISEKYYGVGPRDFDIFRASTGAVQPGGQRLTNPDLIRPGWRLTVPDVPVPPKAAAPAPDPAPVTTPGLGNSDGSPGDAIRAPSSSVETTQSATLKPLPPADGPTVSHADLAVPLTTAGGVVGLLAATLVLVLGRRRLNQRRRRRAGERIAMPGPAAAVFEQELRMVADPLGLVDIDHALRLLQIHADDNGTGLPELLAVRLVEQEISLYFIRPTDLPAPFEPLTSEHTVWMLRPGTVTAPSRATVSPYPALVIIGVDDNDGVLLLELEQLGVLNVLGDEDVACGMLNALAGELAGNPWGEQIQVTIVGMPLALPRTIDRFRIQHVDHLTALLSGLQSDLESRAAALCSYEVDDVYAARTLAAETESWAPHIVLLAHAADEPLRSQLAGLVARDERLGVAVVANGEVDASRATIRVESSGRAVLYLPGGIMPPLPFTPQLLRGRELEFLQELFDTTEKEAVDSAPDEREPDSVPSPEVAATSISPEPDPLTEGPRDDFQDPNLRTHPETEADAPKPELPEAEQATRPLVPYLRFLGPVEATGLNPEMPLPGRGIELMVYLLLRNGPIDGLQIQRAFWPDTPDAANNQRGLAKKVRVALGHTPSGELFLPENINHHGYLLHPSIRSDWGEFRALVGDNPAITSSDNLIAALRLVRGTPFAGSNTRRWWQWIAIPQEDMIAAIMDAADELGNRALAARNASLARYAARIEQAVDPLNEAGWRIELRTTLQAGDIESFHAVLDDLYARVGANDPDYEVDDDTQILIDQAHQKIHA
jgi:hypothetical protein